MTTNSIDIITQQISTCHNPSTLADLYVERAKIYYQHNQFCLALNDLSRALEIAPTNNSASAMKLMVEQIISFSNMEIYNP